MGSRWMVVGLCLGAGAAVGATPMRREPTVDFALDEAFQATGGVQFFYELAQDEPWPTAANPTLAVLLAFDESGRWAAQGESTHVVMSRLVYTVDKDVTFFTEARARSVAWMQSVAPDFDISARPDGGFHAGAMPSNDFTIRFLEGAPLQAKAPKGGVAQLMKLLPGAGLPDSVVVQENFDFSRIMGVRTGAWGVTWTAHSALAPGRTRVQVITMSSMYSLPPLLLGGAKRVYDESVAGARDLIERLRAAPAPSVAARGGEAK